MPNGFDRTSLRLLLLFAAVGTAAAVIWRRYLTFALADFDPLLAACWVGMAALATYRVAARRDGLLGAVAFAGGALIETWGTRSGLWTYFSDEQPPLFILPAWPAAALATERVVWLLDARAPRLSAGAFRWIRAASMLAFVAALLAWTRPGWGHWLTWVAGLCVATTILTGSPDERRADVLRFAAGALVGYPLEYWGTSRACWTYWNHEVPPLIAVFAHGFATLSFARGVRLVAAVARVASVAGLKPGAGAGAPDDGKIKPSFEGSTGQGEPRGGGA